MQVCSCNSSQRRVDSGEWTGCDSSHMLPSHHSAHSHSDSHQHVHHSNVIPPYLLDLTDQVEIELYRDN